MLLPGRHGGVGGIQRWLGAASKKSIHKIECAYQHDGHNDGSKRKRESTWMKAKPLLPANPLEESERYVNPGNRENQDGN